MLSFAIGMALTAPRLVVLGVTLTPPEGFAFVIDDSGAHVLDDVGDYVVTEI